MSSGSWSRSKSVLKGGSDLVTGTYAEISFPRLLRQMQIEELTGSLDSRRGEVVKTTYFHRGRAIFARSSDPNDRLGEFLLRRGTISLRQYLDSAAAITPDKRQGAVLCELGAISPDELVRCVTEQVTEILFSQFDWREGSFEIALGEHDTGEMIVLNIPVEEVILRGIRRVSDWQRVWSEIGGSPSTRFAATAEADRMSYEAALSADETHVLSLVNGTLEIARILDLSYGSSFETCRILWALSILGAIVRSEAAASDDREEDYALAELVESFDRVFSFVHAFVGDRIGALVDHFMDRTLRFAAGRHPVTLARLHLRNQGRVEYEQIIANLSSVPRAERRAQAEAALGDLLGTLLGLTGKELGSEEQMALRTELRTLSRQEKLVAVAAILTRPPEDLLSLVSFTSHP